MLGFITVNDMAGAANRLLADTATRLQAQGWRLAGAVQDNLDRGPDRNCDMDLRILGDEGPAIRISQSLGIHATACRLDTGALAQAVGRAEAVLAKGADLTLIEGAGGWRVPLADQANISDLAMALDLPVILVVGVRLGCISHALLTAEAIARDGLQLAGWVANIIDPKTSRLEENLSTLAERLPAPCLGRVPRLRPASAQAVAAHLQLDLLD